MSNWFEIVSEYENYVGGCNLCENLHKPKKGGTVDEYSDVDIDDLLEDNENENENEREEDYSNVPIDNLLEGGKSKPKNKNKNKKVDFFIKYKNTF